MLVQIKRGRSFLDKYGGAFTPDRSYHVLELYCPIDRPREIRVIDDSEPATPALANIDDFTIVAGTIPPNWRVKLTDRGTLEFGPGPWLSTGYWESFFDREAEAVATFERELATIKAADNTSS